MKATKLPSGSWRINLYIGTDSSRKQIRKSITAKTRKECEQKAVEYLRENHLDDTPMTVGEAISAYIKRVEPVRSESTIRGYDQMYRCNFDEIKHIMADRITNDDIQHWINSLSERLSAKTVRNSYGLLRPALKSVRPSMVFTASLPEPNATQFDVPSDEDLRKMLDAANHNLKVCIMLGAFASLRRGEISFLRFRDIRDGMVYVHGDTVRDKSGLWVEKERPKTKKSTRRIPLPSFVLEEIGEGDPDAHIQSLVPDGITRSFTKLRDKLGMPYHFHQLRHYFPTKLFDQGVSREYIQAVGGWETAGSLDKVYLHLMQSRKDENAKKAISYFESTFMNET